MISIHIEPCAVHFFCSEVTSPTVWVPGVSATVALQKSELHSIKLAPYLCEGQSPETVQAKEIRQQLYPGEDTLLFLLELLM